MFNSNKLKVPHKSFDNFYGLLVKESERGVEKESTKVSKSIIKFRKFLKEVENEISPLENLRYYNGGFSTNLKISSDEGLKLSFIVNDAMSALGVCRDTIDDLNSKIEDKDEDIRNLTNKNKELEEKYDLMYNELSEAIEREGEYDVALQESLDQYVTAVEELVKENQELREELLRLRYFKNVHSEGDQ